MPGLNTASMPDLIFTVLFFFMIATHARDITPKVKVVVPLGQLAERATHRSAVVQVLIGNSGNAATVEQKTQGREVSDFSHWQVQVENEIVSIGDVGKAILQARNHLSEEDQSRMTVAIRADRQTPYGAVSRVKNELRKCGVYDIRYIVDRSDVNKH